MMTKRRYIWAGTLLGLTFVVFAGVPLFRCLNRDHITQAAFEAIRLGMTQREVEKILGGPPGHYAQSSVGVTRILPDGLTQEWWGAEGIIVVEFTEEQLVLRKWFSNPYGKPPGRLGRGVW
jgi:hypothetical protein